MNFIELFAGCGGLSLGLKSVGFELVMANELSPMAAETYAYNFFQEDLSSNDSIEKTRWLSSQYDINSLKERLRENPNNYPSIGDGASEVVGAISELKGGLIVGSIVELNKFIEANQDLTNALADAFGCGGVDVISGGPPCQSFSMAGLRRQDCEKNTLPWEFAKFAQRIRSKIILLENVTGILRPFKDDQGESYYAWFELAKAFSKVGYLPLCLHVNAKFVGVPQNRPRFILIGVRSDIYSALQMTFNSCEVELFSQSVSFFDKICKGQEVDLDALSYFDVTRELDLRLFKESFLSPLVASMGRLVSVSDAIEDLRGGVKNRTDFSQSLSDIFSGVLQKKEMKNHDFRSNNELVRRRFRIYQVLSFVDASVGKEVAAILRGSSGQLSDRSWSLLSRFDYLNESGFFVYFDDKNKFVEFLKKHPTKKQTQKALLANQPAPAALSIPDDACHYHHEEQRTLTVREMARIQSFPDEFEFRSKITTGGSQRSFEVPQYTQVGNAVPPLLGRALGMVLQTLLQRSGSCHH